MNLIRNSVITLALVCGWLSAQNATLLPWVRPQFFDASGKPLSGGRVAFYRAGTTIPVATYSDSTALHPNTNPVILDAGGRAQIWLATPQISGFTLSNSGAGATVTVSGYSVQSSDIGARIQITAGTNFTPGVYTIQSVSVGGSTWTFNSNVTTGAGSGGVGVALGTAYKVVAQNSASVTQWTTDNITDIGRVNQANGYVGLDGSGNVALPGTLTVTGATTVGGLTSTAHPVTVNGTDVSNTQACLNNAAMNGQKWCIIAGHTGISESGFTLRNATTGTDILAVDGVTGGVTIPNGVIDLTVTGDLIASGADPTSAHNCVLNTSGQKFCMIAGRTTVSEYGWSLRNMTTGTDVLVVDGTTGAVTTVGSLGAGTGGSATTIACWMADGKTLGHATMTAGDISACINP